MLRNLRFCALLAAAILVGASGCATFQKPVNPSVGVPTAQQAQWWQANRDRARYVPGRGYAVDGAPGFYDQAGCPLPNDPSPIVDEEDEGIAAKLKPENTYKGLKKFVGKGPNEQVARQAYDEGEALFRQQKYKEAAKKFAVAYNRGVDSSVEEDAMFKAAEARFFSDQYAKADDTYAKLTKKYSGTQYLDRISARRFAIAHYWQVYDAAHPHWSLTPNVLDKTRPLFDTAGHALRVYDRIRIEDPNGPLADDSIMATANTHFVNKRYDDADYFYTMLRTECPKSEFQFQAHLLGLKAKLLRYQGPQYEGAPLEEAEELASQLLLQFPTELGPERERIVQAKAEVRQKQALRDWEIAEYYHKGKYYGASRMYYDSIAKHYPDTRLAQESRTRMESVRGQPDEPKPRFEWLVTLFPESKKVGPSVGKIQDSPATTPTGQVNPGNVANAPGANPKR